MNSFSVRVFTKTSGRSIRASRNPAGPSNFVPSWSAPEASTVSVRHRGAAQGDEERGVGLEAFVARLVAERDTKALPKDFARLAAAASPEALA